MQETQTDLLTESVFQINTIPRKELLPWWIKVFMWIFLLFGIIVPFGLIYAIFGGSFELTLYGVETNEPISLPGIIVSVLFLFKGIVSFGFLKTTDWAIKLGIADAVLGILICSLVMLYPLFNPGRGPLFSFRLELVLLIPYLVRLTKIRPAWENRAE